MCIGVLQFEDIRRVFCRKRVVCGVGDDFFEETQGFELQAVFAIVAKPVHAGAAYQRHAGDKTERLRTAEALGMGADTGETLQGEREKPFAGAVPIRRGVLHQRGEKHTGDVSGGFFSGERRHYARYDVGGAIHYRSAQFSDRQHSVVYTFLSGRKNIT